MKRCILLSAAITFALGSYGQSVAHLPGVVSNQQCAVYMDRVQLEWNGNIIPFESPIPVKPQSFTRRPGVYAATSEIVDVRDSSVHQGVLDCMKLALKNCQETDERCIADPSNTSLVIVEGPIDSELAREYGLVSVRLVNASGTQLEVEAAFRENLSDLSSFVGLPNSALLSCHVDKKSQASMYTTMDKFYIKKSGESDYRAFELLSETKIKGALDDRKDKIEPYHHESLILAGLSNTQEILMMKALCVLPRELAVKRWYQHPRMYCIEQ